MLIAYVSDERYVALPDVLLELESDAGSFEARSRATGAVHVDLPPAIYKVTLQKSGFGFAELLDFPEGLEVWAKITGTENEQPVCIRQFEFCTHLRTHLG